MTLRGMSDSPSQDRLSEVETLCDDPMAYFCPIKSAEMRNWIEEIRRLRTENLKLNARNGVLNGQLDQIFQVVRK